MPALDLGLAIKPSKSHPPPASCRYNAITTSPILDKLIDELAKTRWAAHLVDSEWNLIWVSAELQALLGTRDPEELGVGRHLIEAQLRDPWRQAITDETEITQFQHQLPMMIDDTPGGREAIKELLPEATHAWLDEADPISPPAAWTSTIEFLQGDLPPARVRVFDLRLGTEADRLGVLRLYGSDLPARVLALVGRGDEEMFARMARIFEPRQRTAAILFADLEASGALSRRLASETYFDLIRELTTRIDELIISHTGVVGKHIGDGVTAFFVTEDFASESAAARMAVEAARSISALAQDLADRRALGETDLRLNLALHWGSQLYMGQIVTGGRIEVTALGDEVNQCARLEEAARHGQTLASKALIERLEQADLTELQLDRSGMTFTTIAEIGGVSDKAIRDAGEIAVSDLAVSPKNRVSKT